MEWVDAARGIAIALVVLLHASKRTTAAGSAGWWVDLSDMLATMRMPLFFAVAGLFAATWVGPGRSWPSMLRAKVLLFAWVYAVWVLVRFVWFQVFPGAGGSFADAVRRLVEPAGAGWFVVALAVMFVVAKAVHAAPAHRVVAVAALSSIVCLAGWVRFGNPVWDGVGEYTVFFLLGVTLRERVLALSRSVPAWVTLAVPAGWALLYLGLAAGGLESAPVVGFLLRLAGVAAGVGLALRVQRWAWLRALGRGTLPVYLGHQLLVISVAGWLATAVTLDRHPLLAHTVPLLLTVALVAVTYAFGRVAPRIGLGWLFATPRWLEQRAGAPAPVLPPRRHDARLPA